MKKLTIACLLVSLCFVVKAQTVSCPLNLDFEQGSFANWTLDTGVCCPINGLLTTGNLPNRHVIQSGGGTDPYGGFPVVAPGGGSYSLKLGNSLVKSQAEAARYHVQVPAGVNNYSLIFKYAVVFEDPGHPIADQPRFQVKAYDSITKVDVPCGNYTFVAASGLPGFSLSPISGSTGGTPVYYKSWTTATINLSGQAGKTITVEFLTGDCGQGAHFGYGYVDISCGLFAINTVACANSPTTTLTAPPGFQSYIWKDASLTTTIGTGQSITIGTPAANTQYAVILAPYPGYGCPDTLYTTVSLSTTTVNATKDTTICRGSSLQLAANATTNALPLGYSWAPATGLSCTNCANPVATPTATTSYILTLTNADGCTTKDTVKVSVSNPNMSVIKQDVSCFGGADGAAAATTTGGIVPYSYNWNTTPAQTTAIVSGLPAGPYTVVVTDNIGCKDTVSTTITQPPLLSATAIKTDVKCYGAATGTALVAATGGTAPYTYSWNTTPIKTTAAINGLSAGTYTVTVTDNKGCITTATVTITQPPQLTATINKTDVNCYGNANGTATVTPIGGTTPYLYAWNTTPVQTTATMSNLSPGNYSVTVTDGNGCIYSTNTTITQPPVLSLSTIKADVSCFGGNDGAAAVTATGGTTPYVYSWNTTPAQSTTIIMNLVAGTYMATVTDNKGCIASASVIVNEPSFLTASSTKTDVICFGTNTGTATALPTGGTAPYSYSWNTTPVQTTATATGLAAGTYTVTITDNKGCVTTASATIGTPTQLDATATGTNVSCFNGANGTTTVTATGGTSPYTYSWNTSPVQTNLTATGLSAGTYTVTVTDNNGCLFSTNATITQPQQLIPVTTKTNVSCFGGSNGTGSVTVAGGVTPYTFSWNTAPAQTTTTATGLSAGTYIVTVTDNNGCISSANAIITQPTLLAATANKTDVSCFGGTNGTTIVSATGGVSPYAYNWNTTPAQTTQTATGLPIGTYSVVVTDANGCTTPASVTVTQPTVLSASATKADVDCYGAATGSAFVTAMGGTNPYSYSWNTTPVQNTASATGLAAGTYSVTVTDAKGCVTNASATLIQSPQIQIATSKNDATCFGNSTGVAMATGSGGVSPYSYNWNSNPPQTTPTATGLPAGTYTVTMTDDKGCVKTASVAVGQPLPLIATETHNNVHCFGGNNGAASVAVAGGTVPYTYSWNTSQTTNNITGLSAGTYTATVTDAKGCVTTANAIVTEPAKLVATTNNTNVSCFGGNNGTATVTPTGGTSPYSYYWNTTPPGTTATATGLASGAYMVTVTDANGCITSATTDPLTQPNILVATAKQEIIGCEGIASSSASVLASGGVAPYGYTWNTVPLQTNSTATSLLPGVYTVVVVDGNGCTKTDTVVVEGFPNPVIETGPDKKICQGEVVQLSVTGALNYSWTPVGSLTCAKCPSPKASPFSTTLYTVIGTDKNNCQDTAQVQIAVVPDLKSFVGPDLDVCIGDSIQLHASEGIAHLWSPSTALNDSSLQNPMTGTDTNIRYKVVITENECFSDTLYQNVRVHPRPTVSLGPDLKGIPRSTVILNAKATNSNSIAWAPASGLSCYDCYSPTATLSRTITYIATVSNGFCEASDDITIIVDCDNSLFFVPNTFTPNGDGVNDRFWPMSEGLTRMDKMLVYNRWGEIMFQAYDIPTNDGSYGWDGTHKHLALPPDVYVYYLEATCGEGRKIFLKGDISLIR